MKLRNLRTLLGILLLIAIDQGAAAAEKCRECDASVDGKGCSSSRYYQRSYTVVLPQEREGLFEVCYFEHEKSGARIPQKKQFHCPDAALLMSGAMKDTVRWRSCDDRTYYVHFVGAWPFEGERPRNGIQVRAGDYSLPYVIRRDAKSAGSQRFTPYPYRVTESPEPPASKLHQAPPYVGADG